MKNKAHGFLYDEDDFCIAVLTPSPEIKKFNIAILCNEEVLCMPEFLIF